MRDTLKVSKQLITWNFIQLEIYKSMKIQWLPRLKKGGRGMYNFKMVVDRQNIQTYDERDKRSIWPFLWIKNAWLHDYLQEVTIEVRWKPRNKYAF